MENTKVHLELDNRSTVSSVVDKNGLLQAFVIIIPPSEKQPEGSKVIFDLSEYSRQAKDDATIEDKLALAEHNKALRDEVLKSAKFLAENIPAFTPLMASIAESGIENISLKNPDVKRFGITALPPLLNGENRDPKITAILEGSINTDDEVGYESLPKKYMDSEGKVQDFKPEIKLLYQMVYASKDLQQWPLPNLPGAGMAGIEKIANNTMQATFFVKKAIQFATDEVPTLDDLKRGSIPQQLHNQGYAEPIPTLLPESHKQLIPKQTGIVNLAADETTGHLIVRNQIANNLRNNLANPNFLAQLEASNQDVLSV